MAFNIAINYSALLRHGRIAHAAELLLLFDCAEQDAIGQVLTDEPVTTGKGKS
jgi:hypothetical protein